MPNLLLKQPFLLLGLSLLGLSGCQVAQKSKVSVDYYQISGNSTAALDREIRSKGPRVHGGRNAVAVARIKIIPNIVFGPNKVTCSVTKAKVSVDARVTLPKWTGRARASAKLVKAWDSIDKYTRLHESVHVAIAFRFAKSMETELLKLNREGPCVSIRQRANQIINEHLQEHDKMQRKFDADEQKRFVEFEKNSKNKTS